jgi:hypothetical protein
MRIFSANKKSPYDTQENPIVSPKFREMYESATEPFYHTLHKKKAVNTTLEHAIHLFEEKNRYPPQQVIGPLPIKANGAIVVNRPTNHSVNDLSALPLYLQESDDDENDYAIVAVNSSHQRINSADSNQSTSEEEEEEEEEEVGEEEAEKVDIVNLVHEENNRLRQQILFEREQSEKWRVAKEHYEQELVCSKQIIRNLQRTADRFEKLLSTSTSQREQMLLQNDTEAAKRLRRQSTGSIEIQKYHPQDLEATATTTITTASLAASYERKLQILLNEIEAMEQEQLSSLSKMTVQKRDCDKLARKLKYKDDIIRQLAYDLQVCSHRGKTK